MSLLKCENCGGISGSLADINQVGFKESRLVCDSCVVQIGMRGQIEDWETGETISRDEFMKRAFNCIECGCLGTIKLEEKDGRTVWTCANCGVQHWIDSEVPK